MMVDDVAKKRGRETEGERKLEDLISVTAKGYVGGTSNAQRAQRWNPLREGIMKPGGSSFTSPADSTGRRRSNDDGDGLMKSSSSSNYHKSVVSHLADATLISSQLMAKEMDLAHREQRFKDRMAKATSGTLR